MRPSNLPKMKISLALRALVMAFALIGWMAAPALAEPTIISTDPEAGAEMHEPPSSVSMEFSEPLQSTSGLKVVDECGTNVSDGKASIGGTAMNEMSVAVGDAPHHGTYTVEYVATGVTGTATGSFTFYVHGGTACDGSGGGGGGGHHGGGTGGGGTGGGGGHDGHGGGGGTGGGDHSSMTDGTHDSMTSHTGREMSGKHAGMDMSGHDMNHNKKKHRNHGNDGGEDDGGTTVAAGGDLNLPTDIPTGTTVFVALGLAIALGLVGGWVLRVSSPS